jgi:hypothetical protein
LDGERSNTAFNFSAVRHLWRPVLDVFLLQTQSMLLPVLSGRLLFETHAVRALFSMLFRP